MQRHESGVNLLSKVYANKCTYQNADLLHKGFILTDIVESSPRFIVYILLPLKVTLHPNIKNTHLFLLTVVPYISHDCFGESC